MKKLEWLKLIIWRDYFIACLFFTEIRLTYRQLFGSKLELLEIALCRRDVWQNYLRLPRSNCNIFEQSLLIHGIRIWNSLPAGLTAIDNLTEFHSACFYYFMENTDWFVQCSYSPNLDILFVLLCTYIIYYYITLYW